jgi:hypothetical protein
LPEEISGQNLGILRQKVVQIWSLGEFREISFGNKLGHFSEKMHTDGKMTPNFRPTWMTPYLSTDIQEMAI